MKLSRPIVPDWIAAPVGIAVLILASPVIAVVAAMIALVALKRRIVGPDRRWRRWFAWYPVSVDWGFDTRWLEVVERRSTGVMSDTQYRVTPTTGGAGR